MPLPTPTLPTYELTIPSTGQPIQVRPILVRDEKLLLMALQGNDDNDIIQTTKTVIQNCILDEDVNLDKLPFYDVDYLFIALRAKSVGNQIDIKFTCKNTQENGEICGATFPAKIDASKVKVKKPATNKDITIGGNMSVRMKVPSYTAIKSIVDSSNDIDKQVHIIAACVERITDGDKILTPKDFTHDELVQFIDNLTQEQFSSLVEFTNNFPSFVIEAEAECGKCGFHHRLEYTDFQSFFV